MAADVQAAPPLDDPAVDGAAVQKAPRDAPDVPACDDAAGLRRRHACGAGAERPPQVAPDVQGSRGAIAAKPPRALFSVLSVGTVLCISGLFAYSRVSGRLGVLGQGANLVQQALDPDGFHHILLPVANLSTSLEFYCGLLGAVEIDVPRAAKGAAAAPPGEEPSWRMLSLGNAHVVLRAARDPPSSLGDEGPSGAPQRPMNSPGVGLRLAAGGVERTELLRRLAEGIALLPILGASGVACQAPQSQGDAETSAFGAFPTDWVVAECTAPDGDTVQFWRPPADVSLRMHKGRRTWALGAADSRGRDLFE